MKNAAERPERQVHAGGDVRRAQVVQMKEVGEDDVVEMAAVTRHQYHRMLLDALDDALEPAHLDAAEHAPPDLVEDDLDHTERDAVEVGRDLPEVAARLAPQLALRDTTLLRHLGERRRDLAPFEHALRDRVAR